MGARYIDNCPPHPRQIKIQIQCNFMSRILSVNHHAIKSIYAAERKTCVTSNIYGKVFARGHLLTF